MKNTTFLLLMLLAITAAAQKNKTAEDKRFAGLDAQFEEVLKDWKAPGFAVAVVDRDKII